MVRQNVIHAYMFELNSLSILMHSSIDSDPETLELKFINFKQVAEND